MDKITKKKKNKSGDGKKNGETEKNGETKETGETAASEDGVNSGKPETESEPGQSCKDNDKPKDGKKDGKSEGTEKHVRLFHDDTFKGFFRRLSWSNDGKILVCTVRVVEYYK